MFHLFLTSHMYCRVCYPFLWQCVTLDFSKHSQIPGLAQELQGVCPCCGAAALESTPWSGWPWIFWMMCCDPWLLEQTRVCSMPALVRAIPCMCCGWNIQASPTAGDRTKTWLSGVPQTNSRCVHGCWLNPECFWTVFGAQFVKPQGKLHYWCLPSFVPIVMGSSAVSAAQALLPHPLLSIPLASVVCRSWWEVGPKPSKPR